MTKKCKLWNCKKEIHFYSGYCQECGTFQNYTKPIKEKADWRKIWTWDGMIDTIFGDRFTKELLSDGIVIHRKYREEEMEFEDEGEYNEQVLEVIEESWESWEEDAYDEDFEGSMNGKVKQIWDKASLKLISYECGRYSNDCSEDFITGVFKPIIEEEIEEMDPLDDVPKWLHPIYENYVLPNWGEDFKLLKSNPDEKFTCGCINNSAFPCKVNDEKKSNGTIDFSKITESQLNEMKEKIEELAEFMGNDALTTDTHFDGYIVDKVKYFHPPNPFYLWNQGVILFNKIYSKYNLNLVVIHQSSFPVDENQNDDLYRSSFDVFMEILTYKNFQNELTRILGPILKNIN